jgi:hypothetical protein
MSQPSQGRVLQEVARRLAEVFVAASTMVASAEERNRVRELETARIAEVLGRADTAARRRVMTARRAASAAELQATQALADEMRYQAGSRALAAVHRYAGTLLREAEEANALGRERLAELGAMLTRLDHEQARTLLAVIEKAESERLASANRQAADLTAQIQDAIGALPAPPLEFDDTRPRSRKNRRRARKEARAEAADDSGQVVQLDPARRRTAT